MKSEDNHPTSNYNLYVKIKINNSSSGSFSYKLKKLSKTDFEKCVH